MPNRAYSTEYWQYRDTDSYLQIFKAAWEGKREKVFVLPKRPSTRISDLTSRNITEALQK